MNTIEKLKHIFAWDKFLHLIFGIGLMATLRILLGIIGLGYMWTVAVPLTILIALGKEFYDLYIIKKTGFDMWDVVATVCGAVLYLISLTIHP